MVQCTRGRVGYLIRLLLLSATGLGIGSVQAECYRVSYTTAPATTANDYVDPAYGSFNTWAGAASSGSNGGLPKTLNIGHLSFQPVGTLMASGSDVFYNMSSSAATAYAPEQVLFRCTPDEAGKLYEFYATNGSGESSGKYEDGLAIGIPGGYSTLHNGIVLRVTNSQTGLHYSRYWQSRPLAGLDTDGLGWILVKAKNFSGVRTEIFRVDNDHGGIGTGNYTDNNPSAVIAFKGGSIGAALVNGSDTATNMDGYSTYWPGSINLYRKVSIRRSATCLVSNVTPNVLFPSITTSELNYNQTRKATIQIQFSCQTTNPDPNTVVNFASGTSMFQTAMGILVPPANAAAAQAEGLGATGVSHLLSDGYGTDPSVATGVGVQLSDKNNTALNLLSTLASGSGNAAGWYPVLDAADMVNSNDGLTYYNKTLTATFTKLPGKTVTPGVFRAKAQVIIMVQ